MFSKIFFETQTRIISSCRDKYNWKGSLFKTLNSDEYARTTIVKLYFTECEPQDSFKKEKENCEYFVQKVFDGQIECSKREEKMIAREILGAWHFINSQYTEYKSFPILNTRKHEWGLFDEITTHRLFPMMFMVIPAIWSAFLSGHPFFFLIYVILLFWPVFVGFSLATLSVSAKQWFPFAFNISCAAFFFFSLDRYFSMDIENPSCAIPFVTSGLLSLLFLSRFQGVWLGHAQWQTNIYTPLE